MIEVLRNEGVRLSAGSRWRKQYVPRAMRHMPPAVRRVRLAQFAWRAHVHNVDVGWTVLVKLFGSERSRREITDVDAAKHVAICYARELCSENDLTDPGALDTPEWIVAQPNYTDLFIGTP